MLNEKEKTDNKRRGGREAETENKTSNKLTGDNGNMLIEGLTIEESGWGQGEITKDGEHQRG